MACQWKAALLLVLVLASPLALAKSAAPMPQRGKVRAGIARVGQRLKLAERYERLKRSRVGQAAARVRARLGRASQQVRGQMTRVADRLEQSAPPALSRAVHELRTVSPLSLGAYTTHKFVQDPLFLTGYGVFSLGFSNLQTPLFLGLGFSPAAAVGLRFATGIPIDLAVITLRQRHLLRRQDPSVTLGDALRHIGREYRGFVEQRRQENRAFVRQQDRPRGGTLFELGAGLAPAR